MDRKPRSDSKLDNLPERHFLELRDGLLNRRWRSYDEALSWLAVECAVVSSPAALSAFFRRHCSPVIKQRRALAALRAEAWGVACEAESSMDAAMREQLKQLVFEVLETEKPNPKDVKALVDSFAKLTSEARADEQLELDKRKITLLEEKARKADEASDVMNSDLTEEEKAERVARIFKMGR